jgi:hypothetical protein
MKLLTQIHDRDVKYVEFNTASNWVEHFPTENWVLVIIANNLNRKYFDEIIRKAIDRNVIWISSVGKQQELIHDMSDDEILIREIENRYLPEHLIMTIGEEKFEDGIFNGVFLPINAEENLKEIIILDVDKSNFDKIENVVRILKKKYV